MSEAFLRSVLERKSVAFVLALGIITAMLSTGHLDGGNFATCFSALVIAFMGAVAYQEKGSGA
jgi:hypothetical protein